MQLPIYTGHVLFTVVIFKMISRDIIWNLSIFISFTAFPHTKSPSPEEVTQEEKRYSKIPTSCYS